MPTIGLRRTGYTVSISNLGVGHSPGATWFHDGSAYGFGLWPTAYAASFWPTVDDWNHKTIGGLVQAAILGLD